MMSFFQGSSGHRFAAAVERAAPRIEPLLPVVLFVAVVAAARWWRIYQLDPDEGLNLMKGALVANGYFLYSEIWSDQPPLLTFVLAAVQRIFPFDVDAARAVVLAFSGLLLWSLFRSIRRLEGRACAWLAVAILMAMPAFQALSVSVMVGLPALALAVTALDQTLAGASGDRYWRYLLAGVLFALALQTKFFVALVFPALALAACLDADGRLTTLRIGIARLACLVLGTACVFFAIAAAVQEPLVAQLVVPHYRAIATSTMGGIAYFFTLLTHWVPLFVFLLFLLGLSTLSRGAKAARLIPVLWLACVVAVLVQHRPLFDHQLALIYPPMAWIAALSLNLVPAGANRRSVATAGVAILAMIGVWAAEAWGRKLLDSLATSDVWRYPILLARSPPDSWVAADNLVDAYRAGRLVPPELAVWSDKRQDAGLLPMEAIVSTLEARRPERLLLRRFNVPRIFRKYLAIAYSRMPVVESASGRRPVRFYVRATPNPADAARSPAAEALLTATEALRFLAPNGGFAGHYDLQSGMAWGRVGEPMVPGTVLIRPPASTQEVGSCFLRAHRITGAPLFWDAAKQAGNAIACSQGRYGGWAAVAHRNETCGPHGGSQDDVIETLDDGASQSAVRFLMDLAAAQATKTDRPPFWLADGIGRGLDFFLTAQDENGGWPQQYPKSDEDDYSNYATLNDGVVTEVISTLLHAYRQTGHKRYRSAAKRGGDFLLKAQGPPSQPAWAQQYDDKLRPAAARAFEPAAYGSEETGFAMNALLDLYAATGDDRFLKGLAAARDWLERSTIRPGTWARLYEIGTNRPIYGDHDGKVHYTLAEISEERRAGYRWEGAFPSVTRALARYQALRGGGREGLRRQTEALEREAHRQSHEEALARVPELVSSVRPGQGWIDNGIVDTNTFIENCRTILNALETATR